METLLLSAPVPLHTALRALNDAAPGHVAELCAAVRSSRRATDASPAVTRALTAIEYVHKSAVEAKISDATALATALARFTELTPAAALSLSQGLLTGDATPAAAVPTLPTRLDALTWTMGVTTEASACAAVNEPFITLHAHTTGENGVASVTNMRLSIAQFAAFRASLASAAAALESA